MKTASHVLLLMLLVVVSGCRGATAPVDEIGMKPSEEQAKEAAADQVVLTPEAFASSNLQFETVATRTLHPSLSLAAELRADPDRFAQIGPRVAGRITRIHVRVGDRVRKGDPLVTIDSVELGRTRADYMSAVAKEKVAKSAWERETDLLVARATSSREVQEAEGVYQAAQAELRAARTILRTFGLSDAELEAGAEVNTSPSAIALRSPMAGAVVSRVVSVGQNVDSKDTVVEIADLSEVWLIGNAFERDLALIRVGQSVLVEIPAYPGDQFKGLVQHLGDVLNERTRTAEVRVVLPNGEGRLKPGMFATAFVEGAHGHEQKATLAMAHAALQEVDGHLGAFVRLDERRFAFVRVHVGEQAGDDVEILNGLVAGDVVVTDGSFLLKGELLKASLGEEE